MSRDAAAGDLQRCSRRPIVHRRQESKHVLLWIQRCSIAPVRLMRRCKCRSIVPHWQRLCKTSADEPSTDAVGSASSQLFESQLSPTGECKCTDNPCAADKSIEGAGASRKSAATASEAPAWALLRVYSDPLLQHFIQQKRCCIRLYSGRALSRTVCSAIQRIQRIQLYSYTRYTAYSTIQRPSVAEGRRPIGHRV